MKLFGATSKLDSNPWFWIAVWYSILGNLGTIHGLLFNSFHLDMFISVHSITSKQIASVHILYAIWNVANDVIAGYVSDWYKHKHGSRVALLKPVMLLWPFVTLLPFYHFLSLSVTFHYFLCISLFDGFFSIACIVRGAVLKDMTTTEGERIYMQRVDKVINACSVTLFSYLAFLLWDKSDLTPFHTFLWISVMISVAATAVASRQLSYLMSKKMHLKTHPKMSPNENEIQPLIAPASGQESAQKESSSLQSQVKKELFSLSDFWGSIKNHKNWWMFVGCSVLNESKSVFMGQFRPIFMDILLHTWTNSQKAQLISFLKLTCIALGVGSLFCVKYIPSYKLCTYSFKAQIYVCIVGLYFVYMYDILFNWTISLFISVFMCVDSWSQTIFFTFWTIHLANINDEVTVRRMLRELPKLASMFSMYMGLHAFFAKPLNSIGPIIGSYVLETAGYNPSYSHGKDTAQDEQVLVEMMNGSNTLAVQKATLKLMLFFIFVCTLAQNWFWKQFTLHGKYLKKMHEILQGQQSLRL